MSVKGRKHCGEWLPAFSPFPNDAFKSNYLNPFPHILHLLTPLGNKPFENNVGKGEIARNKQILLFPTVFSTHLDNFLPFLSNLKMSSANSFNLEE